MSTKFSVRPAPRKKPWICKRSPPCLVPPPFPPSLLASFSLKSNTPLIPPAEDAGSLILTWKPLTNNYRGSWRSGSDFYNCTFSYDPITALARAVANWDIDTVADSGFYPEQTIPLPPNLLYHVQSVTVIPGRWLAALTITG